MHPLEKETLKVIQQEGLLKSGERIISAVSGGPDSIALLHVLSCLASDLKITLAAVYVNHGLRPDEVHLEQELVRAAARKLGLEFFTGEVDVRELAARQKLSIEHAARLLRYRFLEKTGRKWNAARIAVAHTADDQAEEIILRLIRGTSRKGLSGMKTLRDGKIIRPFLHTPKSRILAYLDENGIEFAVDSSNAENLYLRNRIRNELLPHLEKHFNPDIRQTLQRTAKILQDEEELLEILTDQVFEDICSHDEPEEDFRLFIQLEKFGQQPRALQRRILEKCCWLMQCEPQSRQIEQLLQLAMKNSPGNFLHLADGLRVIRTGEQVCFSYPQGRGPLRGNLVDDGRTAFPEATISGPGVYEFPDLGKRLLVENIDRLPEKTDYVFPGGEYLDSSFFSFPVTLRGPEPGDRFHPLGAPGSKKVGDFLTDQKIDRKTRSLVPVLCCEDSILALPGLRIDNRYRITDKTTQAVRIRWEDL